MTRIMFTVTVTLMLLLFGATTAFSQTATAPSGSGTEGDPYLIASLNNLYWVTQNPSSWDKQFKQTATIDASSTTTWDGGSGFTPIGNSTTNFTGVYDGQENSISGLFIDRNGSNSVGIFGLISGAQLTSMIVDVDITGSSSVGGIAGLIQSGSSVTFCIVSGSVTGTGNSVGGIVGGNTSSTISNCSNSSTVSGISNVGGVVGGTFDLSSDPIIEFSLSLGNVSGENSVGGLAGLMQSGTIVSNCYSRSLVIRTGGTQTTLGAFAGTNSSGTIRYGYSTGGVSFGTTQGFVGLSTGSPVYTANFFDQEASGQVVGTGATLKTTADMKSAMTYLASGWDHTVWNIESGSNDGYPFFDWFLSGESLLDAVEPSGSGTIGDPYLMAALSDLFWVMQTSSSWSGYFTQTADIDASSTNTWLGGAGFSPIGNESTAFSGLYDGDGHTLTGLFINRGGTDYVGFFGRTSDAVVKDLGVVNVTITGADEVGGLAGNASSSTIIINCYSTGTVTGFDNSIGGLVGFTSGSTISKSYSTANVNGVLITGGFVGYHSNGSTISNSYSRGTVTRISGNNPQFGSFVGYGESAIEYSYSTGIVSLGTTNGFVATGTPTLSTANFFDSESSGQTSGAGATALTTAEMKKSFTFLAAGWDTDLWNIGNGINDGYPYLDWQNPAGTTLQAAITGPPGSGTEGSPYLVSTLEHLYWISQNISSWDKVFEQTNDIDASPVSSFDAGAGFTPIGNGTTKFTGTYDGQGFAIDEFYINRSAQYQALFGATDGAVISNLGVNGNVTASVSVGLLVGHNLNTTITHCYSTGSVTCAGSWAGGLAAENHNSSVINESYSTASVSATQFAGGLVGLNTAGATINDSYSRGDVTRSSGSITSLGGLVGSNQNASIQYSYSTGSVNFGTGQGFVGSSSGTPTYTGNFFDSEASGQTSGTGATDKTTAQMKRGYTFLASGWDSTAWYRDTGMNDAYPYLAWQNPGGTMLQWPEITLTSGNEQSKQNSSTLDNAFVVTVTDEDENLISGVPVTFAIATTPDGASGQDLSVTNTTTDVIGEASTVLTLGTKVGSYTVTATSEPLTGSPVTFTATATAGPAATIALTSGDGQSKLHSSALDNPFVVTVTDEDDNPVSGANVAFAIAATPDGASGQELSVINTTTDAGGEASTVLTLGTKVGSYTVTATSDGLIGSPVTFTATATAGPAAAIVLTSGDGQSKQHSSALDEDEFVVTVTDAGGNPVAGTAVTFAIASTPASATGQLLSVENTTTDASGEASTILTLGNKSGIYTVTASSDGLTGSPVTFTATAEAGAAVTIALTSGDGQSKLHSSALDNPSVVTITDAEDNLVPGVNVVFAIATTPGGATGQELSVTNATTDANGEASTVLTLGTRAGSYTVTATSDGLTGSPVTFTATSEAGPASMLVSASGNNQSALISTALANPFVAKVTDAGGNPISGVAVTFATATTPASATGQEISVLNTTTNASGEASTVLTLGNKTGIYTVTASSDGLTGSPVTFTGSATSSVATTIALTSGNEQSAVHNLELANPFVVTVTDVGGNPVENAAVTFAIASTPEGATGQELSATNTTTNASGEASTTLTLGTKAGTYTVTATSGSLAGSPVTFTATAQVGLPTAIALTSGDGQSAVQSTSLSAPFVVTVTDGGGNPVQDVAVTFTIATTPEGATGQEISVINDTTDSNGEASTTLTLGTKVGNYTVTATSEGLTGSPVTFTATATVGAASSISLTSGNGQSAAVNLALSNPLVVTVTDAGGNPVENSAVSFAIATTPTSAAGQQVSVTDATTDENGEASTALTLGDKVGVYTVTATSGTLAGSPVTFNASATSGSATTIALTAGDAQNAAVGTALVNPFIVTVTDGSENPVEGVAVTFAITTTPEGAAGQELSIINDTTDANGEASTVFTLGGKAGSYTVTATAEGLTGSPVTFTATAKAGAAASIALTSGNSQSATINSAIANPFVVTVTDTEGNPVQDIAVTFAIATTPEGATGQGLSVINDTTGADGKASTVLTLGTKVGSYTVTATSAGLSGSPVTFTATATVGAPSELIIVSGNEQSGPIDSVLAEQLVVRVTDAGENPVQGVEVTFAVTTVPSGAENQSVEPASAITDSAGHASTELTLGSLAGEYVVTASVEGLEPVAFTVLAIGPTSVGSLGVIPREYQLFQNFPNPFNPSTTIRFGVPERSAITVEIYDLVGRLVDVIAEGEQEAGMYQVRWEAYHASSGMYIVRFRARSLNSDKSFTSYRKLMLLK